MSKTGSRKRTFGPDEITESGLLRSHDAKIRKSLKGISPMDVHQATEVVVDNADVGQTISSSGQS